jgi:outer membrane immunogenic protein
MRKTIVASMTCLAMASGAALAADLPPAPPVYRAPAVVPPPAFTWSGCYVDAGAGYGMWNQTANSETSPGLVPTTQSTTFGGRGPYGQAGAGCDYQVVPSILIGAFGDYSLMSIKGQYTSFANAAAIAETGQEKQTGMWAAGARIGYIPTPNFMTYINGGWTGTKFKEIDMAGTVAGVAAVPMSIASTTYNGWFLGGGAETSLGGIFGLPSGLFLRSEYRYTYYSAKDVPTYITATGVPTGFADHVQKYDQMLTTAVIYKFNWWN